MPNLRRRIFYTFSTTFVSAVLGAIGGYFLATAIAVRVTEIRLDQYAGRLVADWEASSADLRTVLAAMGASERRACSGDENRLLPRADL
jgi:hypothetical protein